MKNPRRGTGVDGSVQRVGRPDHDSVAVTGWGSSWPSRKPFELAGADRVLQLADGFGLDLADALAGDLEDAADFFERVGVAVADAVAQLDDLALAVGQRLEHLLDACP